MRLKGRADKTNPRFLSDAAGISVGCLNSAFCIRSSQFLVQKGMTMFQVITKPSSDLKWRQAHFVSKKKIVKKRKKSFFLSHNLEYYEDRQPKPATQVASSKTHRAGHSSGRFR